VIALSLAAQAWLPSNEAPQPVTRPALGLLCSIFSAPAAGIWQGPGVAKKDGVGVALAWVQRPFLSFSDRFTDYARVRRFRLRLRPLHQPGIADSMICQAIQPANNKSPRNTKKHPTTPAVLLSCQFLTSPSRCRRRDDACDLAARESKRRAARAEVADRFRT
jgi:hypothetical protein